MTAGATWTTRGQLRADLAGRLNDYVPLEWNVAGSATPPASNVTFYDAVGLAVPTSSYVGRQAIVTAGNPANVGQVRRVVANTADGSYGGAMVLSTSLPQPLGPGTRIELYDKQSVGVRVEQYHAAINRAIRTAGDGALIPDQFEVAPTPEGEWRLSIVLPDDWLYVDTVSVPRTWGADGTKWLDAKRAARPGESGWDLRRLDDGTAVVDLVSGLAWRWDYAGTGDYPATVRVSGSRRHPALDYETDATPVDYEWLVERALSDLLMANADQRSDRQQWERQGYVREEAARNLRGAGALRTTMRRNSRRIPGR